MKASQRLILLIIVTAAVWIGWTYPRIGELTYEGGAAVEARLYGLTKQSVNIGDMDLVTYQGGPENAEAIIMLHGYTAEKNVWARFARHFTADYRVIIPDLAGHGETAYDPSWNYSVPAQAARVAKLMDALKIEKAHVIGNSMGGFITITFALNYPQRTLSATPVDPGGIESPIPSDMEKMLAAGSNPFLFDDREGFYRFYPMTMAQAPWLPGFVLDAMADKYIARRERHQKIFNDFRLQKITQDLPRMSVPSLLIWGDQDRLLHVSAAEVWSASVPNARVEIMPGLGHMPMVEAPAQTAQIYRDFLQSLKGSQP